MNERGEPQSLPTGRVDAIEVGARKLTIQTEFFPRPTWRVETKIYIGGALKKVWTEDLSAVAEDELQRAVERFHEGRRQAMVDQLRALTPSGRQ